MNAINGVVPLGQRKRRSAVAALAVYLVAAMASGMLVGVAVSALGSGLPAMIRRAVAVGGLSAFAAREFGWVHFRVPDLGLIVPRELVARNAWKAAGIWGAALGAGFLTLVQFGAFWGLQLTIFAIAQLKNGAILGMLYGAARATPAFAVWRSNVVRSGWLRGSPHVYAVGPRMARLGGFAMAFSAFTFFFPGVMHLLYTKTSMVQQ